jgi:LEA14-like dessication related protein
MRGLMWMAMGLLMGGCGLMERPSVKVANVGMGDTSLKATTIIFDMEVTNPYAVPLPLTGADYALSTGGQQFLNGKADIQGTIPAGGTKVLPFPVEVRYADLFAAVKNVRGLREIPYTADLGFLVDTPLTGILRVPVQKEGTLALPTAESVLDRLIGK